MAQAIQSNERRKLRYVISAPQDPTSMVVEFATVITTSGEDDPTTWVAGSWDSNFGWTGSVAKAITPTIGDSSADLPVVEGNKYWLWCRITVGDGEIIVIRIEQLQVK